MRLTDLLARAVLVLVTVRVLPVSVGKLLLSRQFLLQWRHRSNRLTTHLQHGGIWVPPTSSGEERSSSPGTNVVSNTGPAVLRRSSEAKTMIRYLWCNFTILRSNNYPVRHRYNYNSHQRPDIIKFFQHSKRPLLWHIIRLKTIYVNLVYISVTLLHDRDKIYFPPCDNYYLNNVDWTVQPS